MPSSDVVPLLFGLDTACSSKVVKLSFRMASENVFCGFADVLVHGHTTGREDLRLYNKIMTSYPKMKVTEEFFSKNRVKLLRRLKNP